MAQHVFVIHGGNTFRTYEAYLASLKSEAVSLEKLQARDWKSTLGEALGVEYEVLMPRMPNKQNAKYAEWKIWFEKFLPLLQKNIILIGHSLGGLFLAKYLAETTVPNTIRATFLVAAPYDAGPEESLADFVLPQTLAKLSGQAGEIFLYHSHDDPVVPFTNFEKYRQALPDAHTRIVDGRQHFNQEAFPEIVEDIQKL